MGCNYFPSKFTDEEKFVYPLDVKNQTTCQKNVHSDFILPANNKRNHLRGEHKQYIADIATGFCLPVEPVLYRQAKIWVQNTCGQVMRKKEKKKKKKKEKKTCVCVCACACVCTHRSNYIRLENVTRRELRESSYQAKKHQQDLCGCEPVPLRGVQRCGIL